jgi:hypothetical protein
LHSRTRPRPAGGAQAVTQLALPLAPIVLCAPVDLCVRCDAPATAGLYCAPCRDELDGVSARGVVVIRDARLT